MHKSHTIALWWVLGLAGLAGCGGGLATTLSGGSVPIGGRAVTGTVVLPSSAPVANALVTLRSIPANTVLLTTTTDSQGRFTASGVPTNGDISVVVNQPPTYTLQAVIPQVNLAANPNQPLDIGEVNAFSTVAAQILKLERAKASDDADSIISNQHGHVTDQVHQHGYSMQQQQQFLSDQDSLNAQALLVIVTTANSELAAFAANPNAQTADTALNGLLGYVRCTHGHETQFSPALRTSLINAQLAGKQYSAAAVAAALPTQGPGPGGHHTTAAEVTAASQKERTELTSLASLGSGITPFEALVIGADDRDNGGFGLDQNSLTGYLTRLMGN